MKNAIISLFALAASFSVNASEGFNTHELEFLHNSYCQSLYYFAEDYTQEGLYMKANVKLVDKIDYAKVGYLVSEASARALSDLNITYSEFDNVNSVDAAYIILNKKETNCPMLNLY